MRPRSAPPQRWARPFTLPSTPDNFHQMSDLFRREAMEHKSQRFHGTIVLTRTWSYPALTLFLCAILVILLGFTLAAGYSRKETVRGVVAPNRGLIQITAPLYGVVSRVSVVEGQLVQAGDPLFILTGEQTSEKGATQANIQATVSARIAHLRQELAQHDRQATNKLDELDTRKENLRASLAQLDEERAIQQRKVELLREVASRMAELSISGAVTQRVASEKATEHLEQQARLSALSLQRLALLREIASARAASTDLPLASGREASQLRRDIEALKQQADETAARRQRIVRAEQGGRIAGVLTEPGQPVLADQCLASLLPDESKLEVELYAPTRAAGFVRTGTPVLLRYDAFPYQKFGQFRGQVREISFNTITPAQLLQLHGQQGGSEPMYRIRVQLDAQALAVPGALLELKPGMQVSATLVLERRSVAEWILEPLLGISASH